LSKLEVVKKKKKITNKKDEIDWRLYLTNGWAQKTLLITQSFRTVCCVS